jgi:Fur family ferric uptake transcriptional regulator
VLQPVKVSQTPENKFREYLASRPRPQRFTEPQRHLVSHIFSSHHHFDAEQLCSALEKAQIDVSRATVYRTLSKLVDAGLLRQIHLGQRVVYEHDYGYPEHAHMHCQQCGQMIEFPCPELENLLPEVCRKHQFQPASFNLIVHGVCGECNRARNVKRKLDLV